MSYVNTFNHGCIEALHKLVYSYRHIAEQSTSHHPSIVRELSRNKRNGYIPDFYQQYIKSKSIFK